MPAALVGTSESVGSSDFLMAGSAPRSRELVSTENVMLPESEFSLNVRAPLPSRV